MAETIQPQRKLPKLIVVVAFHGDEDGETKPVFGPAEQQSEEWAVRTAKTLATQHAGVIAWSREANAALGEYGEPTTLFQAADVPDME